LMIEYRDKREDVINGKRHLINMLYNDKYIEKYVLGRNENSKSVLRKFGNNIKGIIDDFCQDKSYMGYPIYKTEDIPKSSLVVMVSVANYTMSAMKNLREKGIENILDYFSLCQYDKKAYRMIDHFADNQSDIEKNWDKYKKLYSMMADNESKRQLEKIINFRFNFDISELEGFDFAPSRQYFEEDIIEFDRDEVFVDGGGYCGETSLEFIKRAPDYKKIYFFEPSRDLLKKAMVNLNGENVSFYDNALYKSNQLISFSDSNNTSNKIDKSGSDKIEAVSLDNIIKDNVTFIKMDIEGAEVDALRGAKQIISKYKPKLAICVYHNQSDFWRVPETVLSYRNDYKIYLRHYTEGALETVMYFL